MDKRNAYIWANTRKGGWHTTHSYVLKGTITNERLQQFNTDVLRLIICLMNRRIRNRTYGGVRGQIGN